MAALTDGFPSWRKQRAAEEIDTNTDSGAEQTQATGSRTAGSEQEPVLVWEAANMMEAEIVKGRLESENIPVYIRRDAVGGIYGLTFGGLAKADVLVPAPLAEKAVALLQEEQPTTAEDLAETEHPDVEDSKYG